MRIGLVLGAGGFQGGAWLAGGLDALAGETGWDPMEADHIVGTSAGSMIAALVSTGVPPWFMVAHSRGETFEGLIDATGAPAHEADRAAGARFRPSLWPPPIGPGSWRLALRTLAQPHRHTPAAVLSGWLPRGFISTSPLQETVARTVPEGWSPHPSLWVVACDYSTGRRVAFGREGAPEAHLREAVAASCAIPGFYRPPSIAGRRYVDGGMYSTSNLDLLRDEGLDLVICLNPTSSLHPTRAWNPAEWLTSAVRGQTGRRLGSEARTLRERGTEVVLIQPTAEDLEAMGPNLMSVEGRNRTIEVARRTVARQIREHENADLLDQLPQAAHPAKIRRPEGPPSQWPTLDLTELGPGSTLYRELRRRAAGHTG